MTGAPSRAPHALAVRHLAVDDEERDAYLARLGERVASAAACGTRFWAFEHDTKRGHFVEFIETSSGRALDTALAQDALFAETLDFRIAPPAAESGAAFARYTELVAPSKT